MGTSEVRRGAVAERVRTNIKRIRQDRGLTGAQLADLLGALGRPMLPSAVNKIETGARRVDVDDLTVIALALNTTPNRLLLGNPADRQEELEVAPRVSALGGQVWAWANGQQVLLASGGPLAWGKAVFRELQRDFLRHAQPPADHPAQEAADAVRGRIGGFLGWAEEYVRETQEARAANSQSVVPVDHLIVYAEELRQDLKRLEGQIARVLEESPLADQAEYGVAFFASAELHEKTTGRVMAAREHVHQAQTAYLKEEVAVGRSKDRLVEAREELAAAQRIGDPTDTERLEKKAGICGREVEQAMEAQIHAHRRASQAEQTLEGVQEELYTLRRLMLIRNMVPPQLPPALAYIDALHPTDQHGDQLQNLWDRLNQARLLGLAAASTPLSEPSSA